MYFVSFVSGIGYLGNMYIIGYFLCICLCFNKNIRKFGGFNNLYILIFYFFILIFKYFMKVWVFLESL